jgi:hypothetical protein
MQQHWFYDVWAFIGPNVVLPGGEHLAHVVWSATRSVYLQVQRPDRPELLGIDHGERICAYRGRDSGGAYNTGLWTAAVVGFTPIILAALASRFFKPELLRPGVSPHECYAAREEFSGG